MKSTPAFFNTVSIVSKVAASPAYLPVSILVMVFRCSLLASASSRTVQFSAARAILTCALVTGILLCHCHMCHCHNCAGFARGAMSEHNGRERSPQNRRYFIGGSD